MKIKFLFILAVAALMSAQTSLRAQAVDSPTATQTQLHDLVQKVQIKIKAGKDAESDYADDLKAFDALTAAQKGAKTDDAALIVYMKAQLYLEVIKNYEKGAAIMKQIKADYPDTKYGQNVDKVLASITQQAEAKKKQDELIG